MKHTCFLGGCLVTAVLSCQGAEDKPLVSDPEPEPVQEAPAARKPQSPEDDIEKTAPEEPQNRPEQAKGTTPTHVWTKGDRLDVVVRRRYDIPGSKDWTDSFRVEAITDLVLEHNGLENPRRIPEGKAILLPEREQIFTKAGFPAEWAELLQHLFRVEALYHELAEQADYYQCGKGTALPQKMKDKYKYMAKTVSELKTLLETTTKGKSVSKHLSKALHSLGVLHQGFLFDLNYRALDEEYCDFSSKDITRTKRIFSNLNHDLYAWSREQQALRATPADP